MSTGVINDTKGGHLPALYKELHKIAHSYLRRERKNQTLVTTALVHEAYMRLEKSGHLEGLTEKHFLCLCAKAMREVIVDYARRRGAQKRGGGMARIGLGETDESQLAREDSGVEVLALDEALGKLARQDEDLARIVELRFFGGFSSEDIAKKFGVTPRLIRMKWNFARVWLHNELTKE